MKNRESCQTPPQTVDFEIHVTGHKGELLDAELFSGFPVLKIEALSPLGVGIYTDWMTNIHDHLPPRIVKQYGLQRHPGRYP
jgi:hypothetical protein